MDSPYINVLLIDNYDSFTYNIAHIIRANPFANLQIIQAGNVEPEEVDFYDKIVFSPGPDLPKPGNIMEKILLKYAGRKPILGICLGLQAIIVFYKGRLMQLDLVCHGRVMTITQSGNYSGLFKGLPGVFEAGLYHSWVTDQAYLPDFFEITAISEQGYIMGIRHKTLDIEAVQFHPESIMTPLGNKMINNWLSE